MSATDEAAVLKVTPRVPGLPILGSLFGMIKGPADFFVHCYRTYGPVCRLSILGEQYVLISGVEAANFMGTRAGKECLRSKEFWEGLVSEFGARRVLTVRPYATRRAAGLPLSCCAKALARRAVMP